MGYAAVVNDGVLATVKMFNKESDTVAVGGAVVAGRCQLEDWTAAVWTAAV